MSMGHVVQPKTYYIVAAALFVLLALTVIAGLFPMGVFGIWIAMLIASVKAALIMLFFMHIRWSKPLVRLVAVGSLLWFFILLTFSLSDYFTRIKAPEFWWL